MRRHTRNLLGLMIAHAMASQFAGALLGGLVESVGTPDWLIWGLMVIFFFPILLLQLAGADLGPLDSSQTVVNSPLWAAIVYLLWLAAREVDRGPVS